MHPRPTREVVFGASRLEAKTAIGKGGRAEPEESGGGCDGRARAVDPPPEDEAAPAAGSASVDETVPPPDTARTLLTPGTAV